MPAASWGMGNQVPRGLAIPGLVDGAHAEATQHLCHQAPCELVPVGQQAVYLGEVQPWLTHVMSLDVFFLPRTERRSSVY